MTREPPWAIMGYHNGGYGGECKSCGVVAKLDFGDGEKKLLTIEMNDEVDQDELFAYMYYWTILKLERECVCGAWKENQHDQKY